MKHVENCNHVWQMQREGGKEEGRTQLSEAPAVTSHCPVGIPVLPKPGDKSRR